MTVKQVRRIAKETVVFRPRSQERGLHAAIAFRAPVRKELGRVPPHLLMRPQSSGNCHQRRMEGRKQACSSTVLQHCFFPELSDANDSFMSRGGEGGDMEHMMRSLPESFVSEAAESPSSRQRSLGSEHAHATLRADATLPDPRRWEQRGLNTPKPRPLLRFNDKVLRDARSANHFGGRGFERDFTESWEERHLSGHLVGFVGPPPLKMNKGVRPDFSKWVPDIRRSESLPDIRPATAS